MTCQIPLNEGLRAFAGAVPTQFRRLATHKIFHNSRQPAWHWRCGSGPSQSGCCRVRLNSTLNDKWAVPFGRTSYPTTSNKITKKLTSSWKNTSLIWLFNFWHKTRWSKLVVGPSWSDSRQSKSQMATTPWWCHRIELELGAMVSWIQIATWCSIVKWC